MEEFPIEQNTDRPSADPGEINFITADREGTADSKRKVGRYVLRELLGLGGMGQVYAAYDPLLKREVALKLLNKVDPLLLVRFIQEAQFQARLTHPSVCRVFEVDAVGEIPFIAMERIHGKDLLHTESMEFSEKLKVMIEIAEAVQSAHDLGLIHRDLKPSNILLEKDNLGGYRARVLDFGLARDLGGGGLTVGTCLMGTPPYMAPEQCFGRESTTRSDIYSLGATFFAFLTGRPPTDPKTAAELLQRSSQDAMPSLRSLNPDLPGEMEVILHKCLEDSPSQRYENAEALAEDMRRLLAGDPILAKAPGIKARLVKIFRSHGITLLTVSTLLLTAFAAWGLLQGWISRDHEKIVAIFEQDLKDIEGLINYIRTSPIHDVRQEMVGVKKRIGELEARLQPMRSSSQGPGRFAIGYSYMLLRDYEKARVNLMMAWEAGERTPRVARALGRTIATLYLQRRSSDRFSYLEPEELKTINRQYRDPALKFLRLGKDRPGDSPNYTLALLALCEGKISEALDYTKKAQQDTPYDYEMMILEARALIIGMQQNQRDLETTRATAKQVAALLDKAATMGRSDESVYVLQMKNLNRLAYMETNQKGEADASEALFKQFTEVMEKARKVDPDDFDLIVTYLEYAEYYGTWAVWVGKHPLELIRNAQGLAQEYMNLKVGVWDWPYFLGKLLNVEVLYYSDEGRSEEEFFAKVNETKRMLKIAKQDVTVIQALMDLFNIEAYYSITHRIDATACLEEYLKLAQSMVDKEPNNEGYWSYLGASLVLRAQNEERQGRPWQSWVALAVPALERGIRIEPSSVILRSHLVDICLYEFKWTGKGGPILEKAFRELEAVAAVAPDDNDYLERFARVNSAKAQEMVRRGQDPSKWIQEGLASCARGVTFYPGNIGYFKNVEAQLYHSAIRWAEKSGGDAEAFKAKAKKALEIAAKRHPGWAFFFNEEFKLAGR